MIDNLKLWNSVCETDPSITKDAKIGQMKITAICPQFQRKNATKVFGAYGIGWGIVPNSELRNELTIGDTVVGTYSATMFYVMDGVRGEFPITSSIKIAYMTQGASGYLKVDDDYMKKTQTDALTKGLSFLGFNSDIFEGKFDDSRYVNEMKAKVEKEKLTPSPESLKLLDACKNMDELKAAWAELSKDQKTAVGADKLADFKAKFQ